MVVPNSGNAPLPNMNLPEDIEIVLVDDGSQPQLSLHDFGYPVMHADEELIGEKEVEGTIYAEWGIADSFEEIVGEDIGVGNPNCRLYNTCDHRAWCVRS